MDRSVLSPLLIIGPLFFLCLLVLPPSTHIAVANVMCFFLAMELVEHIGQILRQSHLYGPAIFLLRVSVFWRYPLLFIPGSYPADVFITASNQLSFALNETQKYVEALALNNKNMELLQERQPNSPALAGELICRANILTSMGDGDGALDAAQEALVILERQGDSPLRSMAMNNLGTTYLQLGRLDEGLAILQKALDIKERMKVSKVSLGMAYNNVGYALINSNRYAEAEPFLRKSVKLTNNADPTNKATSLNNLGECLRGQGKYEEAEANLNEALRIRQSSLPQYHPHIGYSYHFLAKLMADRERPDLAEKYFLQAMEIRTKHPGVKLIDFNLTAGQYVKFLKTQGREDEAFGIISAHNLTIPAIADSHATTGDAVFEKTKTGD